MEIGSHKKNLGQDIISLLGLAIILIAISNCSSAKPFQLTNVSPKYKEFEGSSLDPNKRKPSNLLITNNSMYDEFFITSKKTIQTLEFGENVALQAETKKTTGLPLQTEMNASALLIEDLPKLISEIPSLQKKCIDLIENSPNDFDGPSLRSVSIELENTQEGLNVYATKADRILQSLKNLRSDSSNYVESKNKGDVLVDNTTIQEPKNDPVIYEEKKDAVKNEKPNRIDNKNNPKTQKISINRIPKRSKVTGSAKDLFKEEVKEVEDNLTEEERRELDYTEKIRSGLVEVFKWEYYKNSKKLENILLTYPIPRVRSAAALALGRIKSGRVSLQKAIDKDGYQVRPAAYKALSDIGHKSSLSYFISGTKAEDIEVIAASFEGLGKTRDPAGREMIISQGLNSEYVLVVASSLRGLAYNQIPGDVTLIEKFLRSSSESEIKEAAVEALSIHSSRESLRVLEENVKGQPELATKILEAIGKNQSLSATFSLIRLNESIEDEKLSRLIGEHLLRKKAFGKYAFILVEDDFLRQEPNERSKPIAYVKSKDVAFVLDETKKEFAVRINEDIVTDRYIHLKIESTIPGSKNPYVDGWIFSPKVELIEVKKLSDPSKGKYSNLKTGKHQNIFNPKEKEKDGSN